MQSISISLSLWLLLIVVNIPTYKLIGSIFFDSLSDFWESFLLMIQPGWLSFISGELNADIWSTIKCIVFFSVVSAVVTAEHTLISFLLHEYAIEMNDATLYDLIFETT